MLRKILWLSHWGSQKVASDKEQPSQWLLGMTWWSMSYAAGNLWQLRPPLLLAMQLNGEPSLMRPFRHSTWGNMVFARTASEGEELRFGFQGIIRWTRSCCKAVGKRQRLHGFTLTKAFLFWLECPSLLLTPPFVRFFRFFTLPPLVSLLPHLSLLFQEVQGAVERGKPKDPRMDLGSVQSAQIR